jgi:hypothetical protein
MSKKLGYVVISSDNSFISGVLPSKTECRRVMREVAQEIPGMRLDIGEAWNE